jgi:multiple sugar transport system substrate-binding protein
MRMRPVAIALAVLSALALGCGGRGDYDLRYMRWGTNEELAGAQELINLFESQHPDIRVKREVAPWADYWTKLQGSLAANDAPDVFLMGGDYICDFLKDNVLTDITPMVEQSGLDLSTFYQNPVEIFRREGRLWGLPRDCNTVAVYYNRTMFESAGVPLPTPSWTWDDFLTDAEALTRDLDGDGRIDTWGYLTYYNSQETRFGIWVWNAGGEFLSADHRTATIDTPEVIRGIEFLTDLIHVHHVAPDVEGDALQDRNLFLTGRLAMITEGSWMLREFRRIEGFTWDVAPMPRGPARQVTSVNGLANVIWSGSQSKQKAWELVRFLSSPPCQEALARGGTSIPALRSVAESPAFLDPALPPEHIRVFLDGIDTGHPLDFTPRYHDWDNALQRELEPAWRGTVSAAEACAAAQRRVQPILEDGWKAWDESHHE